ncbi:unnamed protein product [Rotaria sordida]|uniref:G-protein coupled receptors family 1 profile domain-containing protein n=1 Tax=Rotaria sordida TaxID=392033 RepID=A0A813NF25_9BILA|nr:unnamed protein product [Rotaria sordida]
MSDDELIMMTTLSYLIVSLIIHVIFFITIIFNNKWDIINISRHLFHRYFKQTSTKKLNSVDTSSLNMQQTCSNVIETEALKCLVPNKISSVSPSSSSLSSDFILESETVLNRTIRSFGLLLCTCLLLTNWLRLGIYLFPTFHPNIIRYSSNLCIIQSFFLHVLTLFHINLTISIRLLWHYCFVFDKYWQTITYRRILTLFLCIFIGSCIFTWPSISNDWASIIFDQILQICIVNYKFHLSYTFFVLSFTCIIPYILLIISHNRQMKSIKHRILKYFSTFNIDQHRHKLNIVQRKKNFQYASYIILIWSFINILLLICIHIPIERQRILKSVIYYVQMFAFLIDPILYIFIFRSLSIITLLRSTDEF